MSTDCLEPLAESNAECRCSVLCIDSWLCRGLAGCCSYRGRWAGCPENDKPVAHPASRLEFTTSDAACWTSPTRAFRLSLSYSSWVCISFLLFSRSAWPISSCFCLIASISTFNPSNPLSTYGVDYTNKTEFNIPASLFSRLAICEFASLTTCFNSRLTAEYLSDNVLPNES